MKRLLLTSTLLLSATLGFSQSLNEYMRLRHQYKIDHAIDVFTLDKVEGTRILELKGTINGSFREGTHVSLLINRPEGQAVQVESDFTPPEWMMIGDTPARMLIKAVRADESSPIKVFLLGAAKEEEISKFDVTLPTTKSKPAPAKAPATPSRGDRSGLFGPIGSLGRHSAKPRNTWRLPASKVTPIYASFIKRINPRLHDEEAIQMAQGVVGFCIQYKVDPRLVMAVVTVESGFDPNSVSHSGAVGLGQLMPSTARWMGVSNSYDIVDNIYGMVRLLATHMSNYSQQTSDYQRMIELTLAAYNAGDGAVRRHGGVPPYRETQNYIRHVWAYYMRYCGQG